VRVHFATIERAIIQVYIGNARAFAGSDADVDDEGSGRGGVRRRSSANDDERWAIERSDLEWERNDDVRGDADRGRGGTVVGASSVVVLLSSAGVVADGFG